MPRDIRAASSSDAHAIAQIHVTAWQTAYRGIVPQAHLDGLSVARREATWASAIESGEPQVLVAESDAGVLGWVAFGRCRDPDKTGPVGEIWAIYVAPARLGHGVGRELWLRACAELQRSGYREVTLWVLAENDRACRFYAKAGFVPEAESAKTVEIGGARLQEVRYSRAIAP
jgi:ribosomal protein S18 acetylase RimI-like enzyme